VRNEERGCKLRKKRGKKRGRGEKAAYFSVFLISVTLCKSYDYEGGEGEIQGKKRGKKKSLFSPADWPTWSSYFYNLSSPLSLKIGSHLDRQRDRKEKREVLEKGKEGELPANPTMVLGRSVSRKKVLHRRHRKNHGRNTSDSQKRKKKEGKKRRGGRLGRRADFWLKSSINAIFLRRILNASYVERKTK